MVRVRRKLCLGNNLAQSENAKKSLAMPPTRRIPEKVPEVPDISRKVQQNLLMCSLLILIGQFHM